jgi:hypothetical protein
MPDWKKLRVCRPAWLAVLAAVAGLGWLGLAPASAQGMGQAALNASLKSKNHCSLIQSSSYEDTVGCLVWDRKPFGDSEARQIEIYRKGELKLTIEPGDPIREWHFWENGRRMEVAYGAPGAAARYALYDLATGKQVDGAVFGMAGAGGTALPQWAKSLSQLQDEPVPEGAADKQARMLWMAKVLRGLDGVKVGMRRKDLATLLAQQGGLSTRAERTYVSLECPYIKVDLKFKAVGDGAFESPEDVVVDVSKAYLGWV